jgi:hypothetical protein
MAALSPSVDEAEQCKHAEEWRRCGTEVVEKDLSYHPRMTYDPPPPSLRMNGMEILYMTKA